MAGCTRSRATVLAGLVLAAGILLAAPSVHSADDKGTWTSPVFPTIDDSKEPDETFEEVALGVVRSGDLEWRAYRGKYRDFVEQDDFLFAVGRRDLAEQMRTSRRKAQILSYGGRAVALTGLVLLIATANPGGFHPPPLLGLGLCVGGLASWIASGYVGGASVTPDQAQSFANRYNQGLRTHIDEAQRTRAKPGTFTQLWDLPVVVPWTVGGSPGAALWVTLRF